MAKLPKKAPKLKCCDSRPKCARCPLRYLKDGVLPDEIQVKRRRLVTRDGVELKKKTLDAIWRRALRRSR